MRRASRRYIGGDKGRYDRAWHRYSVRYMYMHHFGGIYVDLDVECMRAFNHLLNSSVVLGSMDQGPGMNTSKDQWVQNNFLVSAPRHPFWLNVSAVPLCCLAALASTRRAAGAAAAAAGSHHRDWRRRLLSATTPSAK